MFHSLDNRNRNDCMKTGIFMTPIHRLGRSYGEMYRLLEDTIIDADKLGFDEVFLGEHYTAVPEPVSDSLQFFTGLIHRTQSIRFATGMLALPYYHPAKVAADVAMFDHMSGGRLLMGIGTGGLPSDFELFDVMDAPRGEMLLESLRAIFKIWASGPPYRIEGKHWRFGVEHTVMEDLGLGVMPKPYQKPHPPVVVSAMMPNAGLAGLAGENGWGFISPNFVTPAVLRTHAASYRAGAKKAGKRADIAAWRVVRTILVAETDELAAAYLANEQTMSGPTIGFFIPRCRGWACSACSKRTSRRNQKSRPSTMRCNRW
jgi:alkanesulfonate monooxygenase SsuD/methylene tetrahydromethanopterin reductase-like flavin-dependent oxidoreductase (luciferase family)